MAQQDGADGHTSGAVNGANGHGFAPDGSPALPQASLPGEMAILRSMADPVLLTDAAGRVQWMNSAAETLTGWRAASAAGTAAERVLVLVRESDGEPVESPVRLVERLRAPCGLPSHTVLVRPDGTELHVSCSASPVLDAAGAYAGAVLVLRDVERFRRAEKAQAESELRLRVFADAIPTLAWVANADGWITWYNRRWYEYTGATPESLAGWGWQSVHDPARLPEVMERWTHSLRTGEPFEMVFPLLGADGSFRPFLTRITPAKDSDGRVLQWFGVNIAVDDLEQTRQRLAEESSRLAALIEHVPVGLVFADAAGQVTGGNTRAVEIFGHPILHSRGVEEYGDWVAYHANGRRVDAEEFPLAHTLRDGGVHSREFLYQRGDGRRTWVEFKSGPIRNEQGRLAGGVVATLDIDERKRAAEERAKIEQELREKTELIDLAETAIHAGYWSYFEKSGECFFSAGEMELFGLASKRPSVADVFSRIHPEDRDMVRQALDEGMRGGFYSSEFRVLRPDGKTQWLAGQGRLLENAEGERYMVGINFDVTQRKAAEDALRKSEKLAVAGRLAASISHEINNPLESVTNLLYLIRNCATDEVTRDYAISAEEELSRVAEIVKHSLRFHRQSTRPSEERMSTLLESALGVYRSRLIASHVEVERDLRETWPVHCYASELRQVFGNLIGNAFDAIRQGGRILLRTRNAVDPVSGEHGVRVTVADTGHGMDPRTAQRISEPFFTTKGSNGTGLGLWISRDLLKKHRSHLRVRSRQQPQPSGSVFSVFVPLDAVGSGSKSEGGAVVDPAGPSAPSALL